MSIERDNSLSFTEIVISIDTTGKMFDYYQSFRVQIESIVSVLFKTFPLLKLSIIAHGDYYDDTINIDNNQYRRSATILPFTNDRNEIIKFVNRIEKTNGGDSPENYEYVLRKVRELPWSFNSKKSLIMIGDDVPHPPSYTDQHYYWRNELFYLGKVGIRVYGVHCRINKHAQLFYEEIASLTGGRYVFLSDKKDIGPLLVLLAHRENGYEWMDQFLENKDRYLGDFTDIRPSLNEYRLLFHQLFSSGFVRERCTLNVRFPWWDISYDVSPHPKYLWDDDLHRFIQNPAHYIVPKINPIQHQQLQQLHNLQQQQQQQQSPFSPLLLSPFQPQFINPDSPYIGTSNYKSATHYPSSPYHIAISSPLFNAPTSIYNSPFTPPDFQQQQQHQSPSSNHITKFGVSMTPLNNKFKRELYHQRRQQQVENQEQQTEEIEREFFHHQQQTNSNSKKRRIDQLSSPSSTASTSPSTSINTITSPLDFLQQHHNHISSNQQQNGSHDYSETICLEIPPKPIQFQPPSDDQPSQIVNITENHQLHKDDLNHPKKNINTSDQTTTSTIPTTPTSPSRFSIGNFIAIKSQSSPSFFDTTKSSSSITTTTTTTTNKQGQFKQQQQNLEDEKQVIIGKVLSRSSESVSVQRYNYRIDPENKEKKYFYPETETTREIYPIESVIGKVDIKEHDNGSHQIILPSSSSSSSTTQFQSSITI
eukprot:gene5248-6531_t